MYKRYLNRRGAILLFFAAMLPLLIGIVGLAVDLGNMYAMYSKLQNSADAAAMAGIKVYTENLQNSNISDQFLIDTTAKQQADISSANIISLNHPDNPNVILSTSSSRVDHLVQEMGLTPSGRIYYHASISQWVPLYMLGYIPGIIPEPSADFPNCYRISADAYAYLKRGSNTGGSSDAPDYFENLFTVAGNINIINNTQNPDVNIDAEVAKKEAGQSYGRVEISSYYDDNIQVGSFSTTDYRQYLFSSASKNISNNAVDVMATHDPQYVNTIERNPNLTSESIKTFLTKVSAIANDSDPEVKAYHGTINNSQEFSVTDLNSIAQKNNAFHYTEYNGGIFKVNGTLAGDANDPFYVIVDRSNTPQLKLSGRGTDNSRPLIFCYTGTGTLYVNNENAQGSTFRGIIYAPNATVHINDGDWNFMGSIVAQNLEIKAKGTYSHTDILSGNSGETNPSVAVLAPEPTDITWQQ